MRETKRHKYTVHTTRSLSTSRRSTPRIRPQFPRRESNSTEIV